jgi:RNase P subunit RPR2
MTQYLCPKCGKPLVRGMAETDLLHNEGYIIYKTNCECGFSGTMYFRLVFNHMVDENGVMVQEFKFGKRKQVY